MDTKFLADWQFWSTIVALAALILSQLPPLIPRLRAGRLAVQVFDRFSLSHFLGNAQGQLLIEIENTGGRKVKVESMKLKVTRQGAALELLAVNFLEREDAKSTVILTPFSLSGREVWKHITNFEHQLSSPELKSTRALISAMRDDLTVKIESRTEQQKAADQAVEADEQFTHAARAFFDSRFFWLPDEYEVTLAISTDKGEYNSRYRFTMWESDTNDLRRVSTSYSKGFGVVFPARGESSVLQRLVPLDK